MTRKTKGMLLIVWPFAGLVLALVLFAASRFLIEALVSDGSGSAFWTLMFRGGPNILGFISFLGIFVSVPFGIYIVSKGDGSTNQHQHPVAPPAQDGVSISSEQQLFINKWSWGAFFGGWVWALGNKLYFWAVLFLAAELSGMLALFFVAGLRTLLFAVILGIVGSIVAFVIWLKLALHGRRMAWAKGWPSFARFQRRQQTMAKVIIGVYMVALVIQFIDVAVGGRPS